jgi:GNAT superfamily N-acetyltransferase
VKSGASSDRRVETLALAFEHDPGFAWVLPQSERRLDRLCAVFAGSVAQGMRYGGVATTDDEHAVGVWMPDHRATIGLADAARGGMLSLPLEIGVRSIARLSAAERDGEHLVARHVPRPYAYLMALAVHPERRGRGLGAAVVAQVEADARAAGHTTLALRTEQPRNVALYEHLGFELHATAPAPTSGLAVSVFSKRL